MSSATPCGCFGFSLSFLAVETLPERRRQASQDLSQGRPQQKIPGSSWLIGPGKTPQTGNKRGWRVFEAGSPWTVAVLSGERQPVYAGRRLSRLREGHPSTWARIDLPEKPPQSA